eukprot:5469867-Amphidinium_carterae.1
MPMHQKVSPLVRLLLCSGRPNPSAIANTMRAVSWACLAQLCERSHTRTHMEERQTWSTAAKSSTCFLPRSVNTGASLAKSSSIVTARETAVTTPEA